MALSIRQAAPAEGMQWMRDAFRLFTRRPLPFTGMFVAFLVVALLVTLVPLAGGRFAYLALLMDLYSRRIVGWELDDHMAEALVLAALRELP